MAGEDSGAAASSLLSWRLDPSTQTWVRVDTLARPPRPPPEPPRASPPPPLPQPPTHEEKKEADDGSDARVQQQQRHQHEQQQQQKDLVKEQKDFERLEAIKAAARAYALSGQTTTSRKSRRGVGSQSQSSGGGMIAGGGSGGLGRGKSRQPSHERHQKERKPTQGGIAVPPRAPPPLPPYHPHLHHSHYLHRSHYPPTARGAANNHPSPPTAGVASQKGGYAASSSYVLPQQPPPRVETDKSRTDDGGGDISVLAITVADGGSVTLPPLADKKSGNDQEEVEREDEGDRGKENDQPDYYELFVRSLGGAAASGERVSCGGGWSDDATWLADSSSLAMIGIEDDEEDEFRLDSDSDDNDDRTIIGHHCIAGSPMDRDASTPASVLNGMENESDDEDDEDDDDDCWQDLFDDWDLENELDLLAQEDMEAAVTTLATDANSTHAGSASGNTSHQTRPSQAHTERRPPASHARHDSDEKNPNTAIDRPPTAEPTVDGTEKGRPHAMIGSDEAQATSSTRRRVHPNRRQRSQLRELLRKHYQLLLQQSVLAARAAASSSVSSSGAGAGSGIDPVSFESHDDLAEILDAAVGMLQDLDQNRKDAIRHYVQFSDAPSGGQSKRHAVPAVAGAATLEKNRKSQQQKRSNSSSAGNGVQIVANTQSPAMRRLTRAQFSRTLEKGNRDGDGLTVFAIPGVSKLKDTFAFIDQSVSHGANGNLLTLPTHGEACRQLLEQADAVYEEKFVPGSGDLSDHFLDPTEHLGSDFQRPCTAEQEVLLRKNRNNFTVGEDSLTLRGVNLYGEKQWILVSDRFLPDRSANIVSQRYATICVHLYKAHGISIDRDGELEPPPNFSSLDDVDPAKLKTICKVEPPAIINVHRWSLEEDLSILRVVPIMGNMWAEIANRVLPHRDRGHIRKRYQVLGRRVKSTIQRMQKSIPSAPKKSLISSPMSPPARRKASAHSQSSMPSPREPTAKSAFPTHNPTLSGYAASVSLAAANIASLRDGSVSVMPGSAAAPPLSKHPIPPPGGAYPLHQQVRYPMAYYDIAPSPSPLDLGEATPSKKRRENSAASGKKARSAHTADFSPNDDASRAAFEKLTQEDSPGCSQMQQIHHMMTKDDAAEQACSLMTASTTLKELARQPVACHSFRAGELSRDSFQNISAGEDPSSLSILHTVLGPSPEKRPQEPVDDPARTQASVSFLAGVLNRTRQRQHSRTGVPSYSKRITQDTLAAAASPIVKTAIKRNQLPSTPSDQTKSHLAHDSESGLPLFYSPSVPESTQAGFDSPPLMLGQASAFWGDESLLPHDASGANSDHRVLPPAAGLPDAPTGEAAVAERQADSEGFSFSLPTPSGSYKSDRRSRDNGGNVHPDLSRALPSSFLADPPSSPPHASTSSSSSATTATPASGSRNYHHASSPSAASTPLVVMDRTVATMLLMEETDLEAISALNSLSNSPAEALMGDLSPLRSGGRRRRQGRCRRSGDGGSQGDGRDLEGDANAPAVPPPPDATTTASGPVRQSLFSRVVGGAEASSFSRSSWSSSSSSTHQTMATASAAAAVTSERHIESPTHRHSGGNRSSSSCNIKNQKKRRLHF